ncbi:MAG TPA: hypothetical protein DCY06_00120, partial [Bacteroidetes bacterium]|nr:hypothetical protein [Bacteroidota bacterium]
NPKSTGQKYVSEFVNSNGKFYIPASSIKGTLLTILNQKSLGIDPNPNNSVITDKVIFSDSEFIDQTNFNIFTSNNRPPKVNLMCLKKGIAFNLNMKKIGQLNVSNFRNKLKEYCKNQMFLALQKIAPFKSESEQLKGADLMESALNNINNLILADDEYLINLGFGGGSWFKVEKGKTPIFKSKKPGRNNPDEPAHTTVSFNSEQPIQIGWCKLKIEEA